MSRLIVVSNRVAPIQEGKPSAGGLAIGVLDALKETGGVWFGWSGEIVGEAADPVIEKNGNVTYATVGLTRRDYDQYYRGFRTPRCGRLSTTATTCRASIARNTRATCA